MRRPACSLALTLAAAALLAAPLVGARPFQRSGATERTCSLPCPVPDPQPADILTGIWQVRFELTRGGDGERGRASVVGRIAFPPVDGEQRGAGTVRPARIELELGQLGVSLSSQDALAWQIGPDSVRILLDPVIDQGGVLMRGTVRGQLIVGMWKTQKGRDEASGTFVMRRAPG